MVLMKTSKTLTQKKMVRRQLTVMLQRTILNILLVYVGNLAPEVTQLELHCHFHALGAGMIQLVRIQRDKGLGFVRYSTHAEAALAIQMGNAQSIRCGKPIKL